MMILVALCLVGIICLLIVIVQQNEQREKAETQKWYAQYEREQEEKRAADMAEYRRWAKEQDDLAAAKIAAETRHAIEMAALETQRVREAEQWEREQAAERLRNPPLTDAELTAWHELEFWCIAIDKKPVSRVKQMADYYESLGVPYNHARRQAIEYMTPSKKIMAPTVQTVQ
ncbi:MAG TPA: hypothetical protein VHY35_10425 [Stellaceae bacterium]|jgi:hypothetical protein|nr:hypothetical protein [Stellaceae bacterium]